MNSQNLRFAWIFWAKTMSPLCTLNASFLNKSPNLLDMFIAVYSFLSGTILLCLQEVYYSDTFDSLGSTGLLCFIKICVVFIHVLVPFCCIQFYCLFFSMQKVWSMMMRLLLTCVVLAFAVICALLLTVQAVPLAMNDCCKEENAECCIGK